MNWFLILISAFYIPAFAGTVDLAGILLKHSIAQDGPNCFNASLYVQGFSRDLVYASPTELDFYLENFCSEKPQRYGLAERDLVAFINPEDPTQIVHTAVSLGGNEILEKSSLMGSLAPVQAEDPEPGQYLKRDISKSLYSAPNSEKLFGSPFKTKAFVCRSPEQVAQALAAIQKNPAIQEQLFFRSELAKALTISNRQDLESKILNFFVPLMATMKWDQVPVTKARDIQYLQALLRSNAYQMHLLNCSDSQRRTGECHVPHLKKSTSQTESWFKKIEAFEKRKKTRS